MRTIQARVTVGSEGHLSGEVPTDILPGEHRAVLVIDEEPISAPAKTPLEFKAYQLGLVSGSTTFRREDIYADSGR